MLVAGRYAVVSWENPAVKAVKREAEEDWARR